MVFVVNVIVGIKFVVDGVRFIFGGYGFVYYEVCYISVVGV